MGAAPTGRSHQLAPQGVERGVRYLLANQGADGLWRDFCTPAGEASSWPTAYIASALLTAAADDDGVIRHAAAALAADQHDDGGWGYNAQVPTDADSTAWVLLFLSRLGGHDPVRRRAVACLVRHQRTRSGGIATYAASGPIRRFMRVGAWMPFWGWCRPHADVSAVAGRALIASGAPGARAAADAAWRFVASRQKPGGEWSSYWWTSPHYATAQAVELATARGDHDVARRAAAWVDRTLPGCAFELAMSVSILALAGIASPLADRLIEDLVRLQDADGGWPSTPILRIPVPADVDPDHERPRRLVRFAPGIDVADQHRLFTTAACVAALAR